MAADASAARSPRPGDAPRRLARKVLRDDVHDVVLEMLLEGVEPGASLSIDGLARELGVSPTPVREALVRLEHTGLVTRTALRGYRVAPPLDAGQMAELMDARELVEVAAVARAGDHLAELLPHLRAAHARHTEIAARLADQGSDARAAAVRAYSDADWAFHVAIADASGNRYLAQVLAGLGFHAHRMRQDVGRGVSDAEEAVREHAAVLAALEVHDVGAATEAMRAHMRQVRARAVADAPATD
jgi:DNA-binding GntR family transcriptional regulator